LKKGDRRISLDGIKKPLEFREVLSTQSRGRTGTIVKSLVFETNASTNSAIWAIIFIYKCLSSEVSGPPPVQLSFFTSVYPPKYRGLHLGNHLSFQVSTPRSIGAAIWAIIFIYKCLSSEVSEPPPVQLSFLPSVYPPKCRGRHLGNYLSLQVSIPRSIRATTRANLVLGMQKWIKIFYETIA
jgi:hypothetical protein